MAYKKTRSPHHGYRSRCIYLITLNKGECTPALSRLFGGKGSAIAIPGVTTTPAGDIVKERLREISREFPQARILQYIIMPDHVHFIIFIQEPTAYHLGELISEFTAGCTRRLGDDEAFFEPGYHDRILRSPGQLARMTAYLKDNPRRLLMRREHPEFFHTPCRMRICGIECLIFGNFLLLRHPDIAAVRISRTFSAEELDARHRRWAETAREKGVLVSPFISQPEKAVREMAIGNGGNLIIITREEIGERYKPAGRLFDLCCEGRLLIVSTGDEARNGTVSRREAMEMNRMAEEIAAGASKWQKDVF